MLTAQIKITSVSTGGRLIVSPLRKNRVVCDWRVFSFSGVSVGIVNRSFTGILLRCNAILAKSACHYGHNDSPRPGTLQDTRNFIGRRSRGQNVVDQQNRTAFDIWMALNPECSPQVGSPAAGCQRRLSRRSTNLCEYMAAQRDLQPARQHTCQRFRHDVGGSQACCPVVRNGNHDVERIGKKRGLLAFPEDIGHRSRQWSPLSTLRLQASGSHAIIVHTQPDDPLKREPIATAMDAPGRRLQIRAHRCRTSVATGVFLGNEFVTTGCTQTRNGITATIFRFPRVVLSTKRTRLGENEIEQRTTERTHRLAETTAHNFVPLCFPNLKTTNRIV